MQISRDNSETVANFNLFLRTVTYAFNVKFNVTWNFLKFLTVKVLLNLSLLLRRAKNDYLAAQFSQFNSPFYMRGGNGMSFAMRNKRIEIT